MPKFPRIVLLAFGSLLLVRPLSVVAVETTTPQRMEAEAAFNLCTREARVDIKAALTYCRKAVRFDPSNPTYASVLAVQLGKLGKLRESTRMLRRHLVYEPASPQPYFLLIMQYEQQEKRKKAMAVCRQAIRNTKLSAHDRAQFELKLTALQIQ